MRKTQEMLKETEDQYIRLMEKALLIHQQLCDSKSMCDELLAESRMLLAKAQEVV